MEAHGLSSRGKTVLISGGGIAGLKLAYWLHHHGLQPTIIEQAPGLRPEGYAIDFGGSGWDVAERMQIIPALRRYENTVPYFIFKDGAGQTLARLPTAVFLRAFQGKAIQTMRPDLESVLYEAIKDSVLIRFGTSLHVVGRDAAALDRALAAVEGGGVSVRPAETSLEDVFIQFMGASEDNMA